MPDTGQQRSESVDIDWQFISQLEGGQKLDGYVPGNSQGSGVTIASGFDLGQRNTFDLNRLGLPQELQKKLAPYLGKKGSDAKRFKDENPLKITNFEADTLDREVKRDLLNTLHQNYNQAAMGKPGRKQFDQLAREVQTVIASVAWQYGPHLANAANQGGAPKFWKHVTEQDWDMAQNELMDFGDRTSPERRRREG